MNLCVNMLIAWHKEEGQSVPVIERILWIDSAAIQVIVIEISDKRVLPKLRFCNDINAAW